MTNKVLVLIFVLFCIMRTVCRSQNILSWHQNISSCFSNNVVKDYAQINNQSYLFLHSELGYSRAFFEEHMVSLRSGVYFQYERQAYRFPGKDEYGISIPIKEICQNYNLFLNNEVVFKVMKIKSKPVYIATGCQVLFLSIERDKTFIDGTKNYDNNDLAVNGKIFLNTDFVYPIKMLKNNGALELCAGYGFQVYAENFFIDRYNYFRLGLNWRMGRKEKGS